MKTATVTPTPTTAAAATIQHVTKASSDQILSKFAELDSPDNYSSKKILRLMKRQKRLAQSVQPIVTKRRESSEFTGGIVERKSLLIPVVTARRSSGAGALVRVGKAHFRSRNFRNRSFFGTIDKVNASNLI